MVFRNSDENQAQITEGHQISYILYVLGHPQSDSNWHIGI